MVEQLSGSVLRRPGRAAARASARRVAVGFAFVGALLAGWPAAATEPPAGDVPYEEREPYAGTDRVDDHDPESAAHPLRIVAYAVHPVGVALDWLLVRPATWVVRHEPFRTVFGYED